MLSAGCVIELTEQVVSGKVYTLLYVLLSDPVVVL